MFKLVLQKILKIGKERLLIMIAEALADFALDLRRNGYDDRKKQPADDFQSDTRFNNDNSHNKHF